MESEFLQGGEKGCIKADIKDVKKAREKTIKNFKKHGLVEQYREGYTDLQWISQESCLLVMSSASDLRNF